MGRGWIQVELDELVAHPGAGKGPGTAPRAQEGWRLTVWQGLEGWRPCSRDTNPNGMRSPWSDPDFVVRKAEEAEEMSREIVRLPGMGHDATHVA